MLHLLKQNFFLLKKQIILFTISLATPGHVLYRQKNGGGRTILVKHPASIEEHHAPADRRPKALTLPPLHFWPEKHPKKALKSDCQTEGHGLKVLAKGRRFALCQFMSG